MKFSELTLRNSFHSQEDLYTNWFVGQGVISRLSFLLDILNRENNDIGTLDLRILYNSIRQRCLYRFSAASISYLVNNGLVDSLA